MPISPPNANQSSLSVAWVKGLNGRGFVRWVGLQCRCSAGFQDGGRFESVKVLVFGHSGRAVTQVVGLDDGWWRYYWYQASWGVDTGSKGVDLSLVMRDIWCCLLRLGPCDRSILSRLGDVPLTYRYGSKYIPLSGPLLWA